MAQKLFWSTQSSERVQPSMKRSSYGKFLTLALGAFWEASAKGYGRYAGKPAWSCAVWLRSGHKGKFTFK